MGVKVTFDGVNKIIQINEAPVSFQSTLDVQIDLYSDMKEDWRTDPTLNKLRPPIKVIGGQPTTGGDFAGDIYFLDPAWKIRPYEGNHRLVVNGSIFSEDGNSVFTFTLAAYQVVVEMVTSSLVTKTTGGGIDSTDLSNIAAAVWSEPTTSITTIGSIGEYILTKLLTFKKFFSTKDL